MKNPVLLITGTDEYRCHQMLRKVVNYHNLLSWRIESIEGTDAEIVSSAMMSTGLFFQEEILFVITNPQKLPTSLVADHIQDPTEGVRLLLVHQGTIKKSSTFHKKVVSFLGNKQITQRDAPAVWDLEKDACAFVRQECKEQGILLEDLLVKALVRKCGTDLGILSWEIFKLSFLGDPTAENLRSSISVLTEASVDGLLRTLILQSKSAVLRELTMIRDTHSGDPTMKVTGIITTTVLKWLAAIHLHESGVSSSDASDQFGVNSWYWDNKLLPAARAIGSNRLKGIVKALSDAQHSATTGAMCPWIVLESGLIRALNQP